MYAIICLINLLIKNAQTLFSLYTYRYRWRNSCDSIASEVIPTTSELRQSSSQPDLRPDDEEIRFRIDYRTIELSKSEKKLSSYTTSVIQNDVDVCDDVFDDIKTQQKTIPSISRKSFAASRYKVDSLSAESGIAEMLSSVSPSPTNNDDRMTSAGMWFQWHYVTPRTLVFQ